MLGILWNDEHHPELVDMPFVDKLVRPNKYRPKCDLSDASDTISDKSTVNYNVNPPKDRRWSYVNRSSTTNF